MVGSEEISPKQERSIGKHKEALTRIVHPDQVQTNDSIFAQLEAGEIDTKSAKAQVEKLIIEVASTDHMTGLDNARAAKLKLQDLMEYCELNSLDMVVMYLDGDGIKALNTISHLLGDLAIESIASAIEGATRPTDLPARLSPEQPYDESDPETSPTQARVGGDEFLLLLPGAKLTDAETIYNRIKQRLSDITSVTLPGRSVTLTAGAVSFIPGFDKDSVDFAHRAERAMQFGKENGKGDFYASAEPLAGNKIAA